MTSFFGGDRTMSHFSVRLPDYKRGNQKHFNEELAAWRIFKEQDKTRRATLKVLGWKEVYCQYKTADKAAKVKAKKKADSIAAKWEAKTGFKFEVNEGFFM
jgi:hypothetical protein